MEGFTQILKPSKVRVETDDGSPNKARIIIEPLDRGFGYTLGNALRRVLLSSMPGCAIVEVRLDNVLHEYTAIEGVKEDVTNILLNLKDVAIAMHARDTAYFNLKKKGPGVMVAGDIDVGHDGEVINPDHVIAHLTGEMEVGMSIKVIRGRGYQVSSEIGPDVSVYDELAEAEDPTGAIGSLRLDASFSPVRRVAYTVQSTRVEKRTDLDRLTMELETNGTMTPQQALSEAAGILIDQFSVFAASRPAAHETADALATGAEAEKKMEQKGVSKALLNEPIEKLGLSQRSANRLKSENIHQIGALVSKSEMDLLRTPSFGQKSLAEVQAVLNRMDLSLGMNVGDWTPAAGISPGGSSATLPVPPPVADNK